MLDKKDNNKKRKVVALLILLFVVLVSGITYAFFVAEIINGDKGSSVNINTATLALEYSEDPIVCESNIMPGTSCTHNFYVKNIGGVESNYYVYLTDVINTFATKSDLVYTVTCQSVKTSNGQASGTCFGKEETIFPNYEKLIVNQDIGVGITHKYTMTITFKETGVNQNDNQGKTFSGKILVVKDERDMGSDGYLISAVLPEPDYGDPEYVYVSPEETLYLDGPIYRKEIESIVFETTNTVPGGVLGSWDVSEQKNGAIIAWYTDTDLNDLYEVTIGQNGGVIANPDSSELFYYLTSLASINFNNFITVNVHSMAHFFYFCPLKALDLRPLDTSNVTNMGGMFGYLRSLESLNLTGFNTANVINMNGMFGGSTLYFDVDFSSFDTRKVEWMSGMFAQAGFSNLDLSSFYTDSLTTIYNFLDYASGSSVDMRNFNFSNVSTYYNMFGNSPFPPYTGFYGSVYVSLAGKTWINSKFPGFSNIIVV